MISELIDLYAWSIISFEKIYLKQMTYEVNEVHEVTQNTTGVVHLFSHVTRRKKKSPFWQTYFSHLRCRTSAGRYSPYIDGPKRCSLL
jgi:hypothetical protein